MEVSIYNQSVLILLSQCKARCEDGDFSVERAVSLMAALNQCEWKKRLGEFIVSLVTWFLSCLLLKFPSQCAKYRKPYFYSISLCLTFIIQSLTRLYSMFQNIKHLSIYKTYFNYYSLQWIFSVLWNSLIQFFLIYLFIFDK